MAIETATTAAVSKLSTSSSRQFRSVIERVIVAKVTFEEDSIAAGASSAAVYTITGAALGDFVLVNPMTDLGDDIIFTASVTAANEVTVIATDASAATNTSAATVGNLNIMVLGVDADVFAHADSF